MVKSTVYAGNRAANATFFDWINIARDDKWRNNDIMGIYRGRQRQEHQLIANVSF